MLKSELGIFGMGVMRQIVSLKEVKKAWGMVVIIKKDASKQEIEKALAKLYRKKRKKLFDLRKYMGVIRLKEDPVSLQKKWRDEWQ